MRLVSAIITIDVEIDGARIEGQQLVLSGFAGINEIETHVSGAEVRHLLGIIFRWPVLWRLVRIIVWNRKGSVKKTGVEAAKSDG